MKISKNILFLILLAVSLYGQDTVKIMTYNILNYDALDTSRHPYFRTVVQSSNPDILVVEEINTQFAVDKFRLSVMNSVSPGNYSSGAYINGPDSDNAIFLKSSKFTFISNSAIDTELRDINEFKVIHIQTGDTLRIYAVHLKAGSSSADSSQRAREVQNLRNITNSLPINTDFIVLGDFNFYSSYEPAYNKLLLVTPGNEGHFIDMFNMPGVWNNSGYSVYHTQSPRTRAFGSGATGGMDDRFDLILYSKAVSEQGGITIIPQSIKPYGNDGNHFNDSINKPPNNAVSQIIANALHYGSDHLPVYALFKFESNIGIQQISNTVPEEFLLKQNYPNPFNPVTKFEFRIPEKGQVKLVVFDILGNQVEVIADNNFQAGVYSVSFDASNLPSGTYFYRLSAGDYIQARKMILLK